MTPEPLDWVRRTLILVTLALCGELGLVLFQLDWNRLSEWDGVMVIFLSGPLLFLGLLSWRRRLHPTRSRMLFRLAFVLGSLGLLALGAHAIMMARQPPPPGGLDVVPLLVALVQWVAVLPVWVSMARQET